MNDGYISVAVYNNDGTLENIAQTQCDGDSRYTLTIPTVITTAKTVKVFVWQDMKSMTPLGMPEIVQIP